MDYKSLRKRALFTDIVCIAIAGCVLYLGSKSMLPNWALIVGLALALVALTLASMYSFKARKLERAEYDRLVAENERKQRMTETETCNESKVEKDV